MLPFRWKARTNGWWLYRPGGDKTVALGVVEKCSAGGFNANVWVTIGWRELYENGGCAWQVPKAARRAVMKAALDQMVLEAANRLGAQWRVVA